MKKLGQGRRVTPGKRKPEPLLGPKYLAHPNHPVTRAELALVTRRTLKAVEAEFGRRTLAGLLGRLIAWVQVAWLGYFGPRKEVRRAAT